MMGVFESAARWNRHYQQRAAAERDQCIALIREHAAAIRAAYAVNTRDDTSSAVYQVWYTWCDSIPAARATRDNHFHYAAGRPDLAPILAAFRQVLEGQQ